ncbi:MAG: hypothetical protein O3B13_14815 [Planctomycetota bacterium]|nr:hypothetical protein [Planctomycetota bacterium]
MSDFFNSPHQGGRRNADRACDWSHESHGRHAVERPVKFQEVFATLYKNAGLDTEAVRIFDQGGTPRYLVDNGIEPIHELI